MSRTTMIILGVIAAVVAAVFVLRRRGLSQTDALALPHGGPQPLDTKPAAATWVATPAPASTQAAVASSLTSAEPAPYYDPQKFISDLGSSIGLGKFFKIAPVGAFDPSAAHTTVPSQTTPRPAEPTVTVSSSYKPPAMSPAVVSFGTGGRISFR